MDGCVQEGVLIPARWENKSEAAGEVQCCSMEGVCNRDGCLSGNNDADLVTWHQAVELCAANSDRLCTKEELLAEDASGCCGTGCHYDFALVWTSTVESGGGSACDADD